MAEDQEMETIEGQKCPMCMKDTLTLRQVDRDLPYVGKVYVFSMECQNCDYKMSDIEFENEQKPIKLEFEVSSEADLNVRIVKSAAATLKIPRIVTVAPGPISEGYISNVEGVLKSVQDIIKEQKDDEDPDIRKKAKNMLKKLQDVLWGRDKLLIQIDDPTGNSAIISERTVKK
jgi:zinc finger protein